MGWIYPFFSVTGTLTTSFVGWRHLFLCGFLIKAELWLILTPLLETGSGAHPPLVTCVSQGLIISPSIVVWDWPLCFQCALICRDKGMKVKEEEKNAMTDRGEGWERGEKGWVGIQWGWSRWAIRGASERWRERRRSQEHPRPCRSE